MTVLTVSRLSYKYLPRTPVGSTAMNVNLVSVIGTPGTGHKGHLVPHWEYLGGVSKYPQSKCRQSNKIVR